MGGNTGERDNRKGSIATDQRQREIDTQDQQQSQNKNERSKWKKEEAMGQTERPESKPVPV